MSSFLALRTGARHSQSAAESMTIGARSRRAVLRAPHHFKPSPENERE
jgi:hypothetical protein